MKKQKTVFHDLGFSDQESMALAFKADIYAKILDVIQKRKLKGRDLEKILDVPQPRVSELLNSKLSSTSIEKLLNYLERLGVAASISFKNDKVA
jgi:predicted XRE-type DNA-binding protein